MQTTQCTYPAYAYTTNRNTPLKTQAALKRGIMLYFPLVFYQYTLSTDIFAQEHFVIVETFLLSLRIE